MKKSSKTCKDCGEPIEVGTSLPEVDDGLCEECRHNGTTGNSSSRGYDNKEEE